MGDKRAGYKASSSYLLNAGLDEIYGITNGYIKPNERRELKEHALVNFLFSKGCSVRFIMQISASCTNLQTGHCSQNNFRLFMTILQMSNIHMAKPTVDG